MKLKQIVDMIDKNIPYIAYRTIISIDSDDVDLFTGACRWNDGRLIPLDGDNYSLNDEIKKYEYDKDNNILVVWYDSEWMKG